MTILEAHGKGLKMTIRTSFFVVTGMPWTRELSWLLLQYQCLTGVGFVD